MSESGRRAMATSPASAELAILLPLGVIANRLMAIEADLRFINMKASDCAQTRENAALAAQAAAQLERISEALDLIRDLVSEMETALHPRLGGSDHDD
jgi:hypothetical protein